MKNKAYDDQDKEKTLVGKDNKQLNPVSLKRPRGRPRKSSLLVDSSSSLNLVSKDICEESDTSFIKDHSDNNLKEVKKKGGRPRKSSFIQDDKTRSLSPEGPATSVDLVVTESSALEVKTPIVEPEDKSRAMEAQPRKSLDKTLLLVDIFDNHQKNIDFETLQNVCYGQTFISLTKGVQWTESPDNGEGKTAKKFLSPIPGPKPDIQNVFIRKVYFLYAAAVSLILDVELDKFTVRLITACVMAPYRFGLLDKNYQSVVDLNTLTQSKEGILSKAYLQTTQEVERFMTVTDDFTQFKRYKYTNSVPTYKELKDSEAYSIVADWMRKFFVEVPKEVETVQFQRILLKYLAIGTSITRRKYEDKMPVGSFFKQGVASVNPESNEVIFMNYSTDVVTPDEVIPVDYKPATFVKVPDSQSYRVSVSKDTENLLKVLCGDNNYNLNILRGFIRNVITAKFEGRYWQSALYLYGAPGTSKSVWVELIKKLVPKNFVQEFSRSQNQFKPGQLANTNLLVVSDLTEITQKQKDVLKRLLGRATFTLEEKNQPDFGMIAPHCQVIIVSNSPPRHFRLFADDQALLDKLIQVYLGPELQIPSEYQVANMPTMLNKFCPDIFNWAMYGNKNNLRYFIRAVTFNQLFEGGNELKGIHGYIQTCLFKSSGSFLSLADLKSSVLKYCTMT